MRFTMTAVCTLCVGLFIVTTNFANEGKVVSGMQTIHSTSAAPRFRIDLKLDREVYYADDTVHFTIHTERDAYLYIFGVNATNGKVSLLFPNDFAPKTKLLKAGKELVVPSPDIPYTFQIIPPYGDELFVALATQKPLVLKDKEEARQFARFFVMIRASVLPSVESVPAENVENWPDDWAFDMVWTMTIDGKRPNRDSQTSDSTWRNKIFRRFR